VQAAASAVPSTLSALAADREEFDARATGGVRAGR